MASPRRRSPRASIYAIGRRALADQIERAMEMGNKCHPLKRHFNPLEFGFDFSSDEFAHYVKLNSLQHEITGTNLNFETVLAAYRERRSEPKAA